MIKKIIDVFYDTALNSLITSNVNAATRTTEYPAVYTWGDYVLRYRVYDAAPSTINLDEVDTYDFKIGITGTTAAYLSINTAGFNVEADWDAINTAAGQICVAFDTNVAALQTATGTAYSKTFIAEIYGTNTTSGDTTMIVSHPITVMGTIDM